MLMVGYYGYQNAGDNWLCRRAIDAIKSRISSACFAILMPKSGRDDDGVWVDRFSAIAVARALVKTDAVVFGGGSIFQDKTSVLSWGYYWTILIIARMLQKRVILLGQGIGPLRPLLMGLTAVGLRGVAISVRDSRSYQLLAKWRVSSVLASDLMYWQYRSDNGVAVTVKPTSPGTGCVGLSFRPFSWPGENLTAVMVAIQSLDRDIVFWDMHRKVDYDSWVQSGGCQNRVTVMDVSDRFDENPGVEFAIVMRLHAMVYASRHEIPVLALGYDEKVIELATELHQPVIDIRVPGLTSAAIFEKITDIMTNIATYSSAIKSRTSIIAARSNAHWQVVDQLK